MFEDKRPQQQKPDPLSRDEMKTWALERLEEFRVRYGHTEPIEAWIQRLESESEGYQKRIAALERVADALFTKVICSESRE